MTSCTTSSNATPMPLPKFLPELLAARPKQEIIEHLTGEQRSFTSKGRAAPYLISRCKACTLNFTEAGRLAQLVIEHCSDTQLLLCGVIGSTDVVHSQGLSLVLPHENSSSSNYSITIDACSSVKVITPAKSGLVLYTSASAGISIEDGSSDPFHVEAPEGQKMRTSWDNEHGWVTRPTNEFGDV